MGLSLLLSSCGFSREIVQNSNQQQTNVVLSKSNYRVIGEVEGKSSQVYVLGIGGLSDKSLSSTALSEMYHSADKMSFGKSYAVINVNVGIKNCIYLFLAGRKKAIARGTLIEFLPEDEGDAANPANVTLGSQQGKEMTQSATQTSHSNSVIEKSEKNEAAIAQAAPETTAKSDEMDNEKNVSIDKLTLTDGKTLLGTVKEFRSYNRRSGKMETMYSITEPNGKKHEFQKTLVASNEKVKISGTEYRNLKLGSHK